MAKGTTYSVRNTAPGARGYDAKTGFTELDAGATATEVTFADGEYENAKATVGLKIFEGEAPADDDAGDETPDGAKAYADITVSDLKKHLTDAGVEFESDANKKALYEQYAGTFAPLADSPPVVEPTDELDKMADADLRDTVKALTGDEPPADADRETLLKLARGE